MVLTNILVVIIQIFSYILTLVFGWFPSVNLDTSWVVYVRNILNWAEYFFPIDVLYAQFRILVVLVSFYLLFKLVRFIIRR